MVLSAVQISNGVLSITLDATEQDISVYSSETADQIIVEVDQTPVTTASAAEVDSITITANDLPNDISISGIALDDVESTTINARGGNDTVEGSMAQDSIQAGAGDDVILGGGQEDFIDGGDGNDWIQGNGGNDTLIAEIGEDSVFGQQGNDYPFDFAVPETAPTGTTLGQLSPVDVNSVFSITSGDPNGLFAITPQGQLKTASELDFEAQAIHELTLSIVDSLGNDTIMTIDISVLNVPEWVNVNVDSNNDGAISAADDLVEESSPVYLAVNDDDGNANGMPDLGEPGVNDDDELETATIELDDAGPMAFGYQLVIELPSGISAYADSGKMNLLASNGGSFGYTIGIDTIPEEVYLEATDEGNGVIRAVVLKQDGTQAANDNAKVRQDKYSIERSVRSKVNNEIVTQTGKVSDGLRRQVWIGEKVSLKAKGPLVANFGGVNFNWTKVSNKYVKDVKISLAKGVEKTSHKPNDLKKRDLELYWLDPGNKKAEGEFRVVGTGKLIARRTSLWSLGGPVTQGKNKLIVEQATPIRANQQGQPVSTVPTFLEIGDRNGGFDSLSLAMEIRHRIKNPSTPVKTFEFIQKGNAEMKLEYDDGAYQEASVNDHNDGGGSWNYGKSVGFNNQLLPEVKDVPRIMIWKSPGPAGGRSPMKASVTMSMEIRVVFRPDVLDAVFVPVKLLTWNWQAKAEQLQPNVNDPGIAWAVGLPTGASFAVTAATGTSIAPGPGQQWDQTPRPGELFFLKWKEAGNDTSVYPTWVNGKLMSTEMNKQFTAIKTDE